MSRQIKWTHPSVTALAGEADPVTTVAEHARALVFDAVERGWSGPPFDPISLAELRGIELEPSAEVNEARLVPGPAGKFTIEFNPERPRNRVRYSVAHEIAHTLFPDASERIRYRNRTRTYEQDHWQLEALCDLAAAEILMPIGAGGDLQEIPVHIDAIAQWHEQYQVSMEAALLRVVKLTDTSCAAFAAARVDEHPDGPPSFRIDYCIGSRAWRQTVNLRGRTISSQALSRCTAVGYTAKASERWWSGGQLLKVECVGAPPYPESIYPRVVGVLLDEGESVPGSDIRYLVGDATAPHIEGNSIIAHIVNDKTPIWGAGFGKALANKFPDAQAEFRRWARSDAQNLRLGESHHTRLSDDLFAFHMIAQRGYKPAARPLIRYHALDSCLRDLARFASERQAMVHMPLIGTGHAGGNWPLIKELIREHLASSGIPVTIYMLPGHVMPVAGPTQTAGPAQLALNLEGR